MNKKSFIAKGNSKPGTKSLSMHYGNNVYALLDYHRIAILFDRDYPNTASDRRERSINNLYLMLNIWLNLIRDMRLDYVCVLAWVQEIGLKQTLADCADHRLWLVSGEKQGRPVDWLESCMSQLTLHDYIFLLGYPKRTLIDAIDEQALWNDFKASNKLMSDRCYSPYLASILRSYIDDMIKGYKRDVGKFILPPGATYEGAHSYLEKFRIARKQCRWLREHGVNIPWFPMTGDDEPANCSRYMTVPKNFKTRRGIAPEPVSRQILGYQVDSSVRALLQQDGVDLSDQERNQLAARIGSVISTEGIEACLADPLARKYPRMISEMLAGKRVATIDMSAASDSIRAILVSDILWGDLYDDICTVRTPFVEYVSGKRRESIRSHRWSTMGSTTTFWLESLIFRAIMKMSYDMYSFGLPESDKKLSALDTVYGDDCTIDVDVAPIFIDLLECFGFTVNREKTFVEGSYRESCGKEYIDGQDITTLYYPRGTSRYELPQLVSIQHKLYMYPATNGFIKECIGTICPNITMSEIGSTHDDLWSVAYRRNAKKGSCYGWYNRVFAVIVRRHVSSDTAYQLKDAPRNENVIEESVVAFRGSEAECSAVKAKLSDWSRKKDYQVDIVFLRETLANGFVRQQSEDLCYHTTFSTRWDPVDPAVADECELLMYLLTLGGGIEHVNNSPFTDIRDMIHDRRSLCGKGSFQTMIKPSFD
jgi:hypothetical protein